jgi:hypothetical protein
LVTVAQTIAAPSPVPFSPLRREERLEDAGSFFGCHPNPIVAYRDCDQCTLLATSHLDDAAIGQRVARVEHQVEHDLLEGPRREPDVSGVLMLRLQRDIRGDEPRDRLHDARELVARLAGSSRLGIASGEREQLLRRGGCASDALPNLVEQRVTIARILDSARLFDTKADAILIQLSCRKLTRRVFARFPSVPRCRPTALSNARPGALLGIPWNFGRAQDRIRLARDHLGVVAMENHTLDDGIGRDGHTPDRGRVGTEAQDQWNAPARDGHVDRAVRIWLVLPHDVELGAGAARAVVDQGHLPAGAHRGHAQPAAR